MARRMSGSQFGFTSRAARERFGRASLSICMRFAMMLSVMKDRPVMLPPGRARLDTNLRARGSVQGQNTIGMVEVARWAAKDDGFDTATSTSTLRRAKSAARL